MMNYLKVKYVDVINFEMHQKNKKTKKKDRWLEDTDGYACDKANIAKCSL